MVFLRVTVSEDSGAHTAITISMPPNWHREKKGHGRDGQGNKKEQKKDNGYYVLIFLIQ